jgi:leucyl-tRNA synthetase
MYYREALRTAFYEFSASFDQYRDICKSGKILPNKILTLRYLEWQMIILSPICPHFCEHGWGLLGKTGSVLDARWPTPTAAVDPAMVSQGRYMYEKVPHDFIKLQEKAEKSSKPPGKAVASTVYVAKVYPEWKVTVLAKLRARLASGELPLIAQDELQKDDKAKTQWKAVMQELMQDAALKPVSKHVGPFAAFKRDEAVQFGASALDASVPFDELALVKENVEYLKDKLKVDMAVLLVDDCTDPAHKDAAATAQPGAPAIKFTVEAGGSGYPKA